MYNSSDSWQPSTVNNLTINIHMTFNTILYKKQKNATKMTSMNHNIELQHFKIMIRIESAPTYSDSTESGYISSSHNNETRE